MRSDTADAARRLNAIARFSLEEALEFVSEDELAGQAHRLPRSPRELLPAGHLALSLKDAVSLPDLGEITKRYRRGRSPDLSSPDAADPVALRLPPRVRSLQAGANPRDGAVRRESFETGP